MSCEAHRQQALAAILSAHPGKGLSPADAERIYQEHKQAHPSLSYETLTQLAGVAAQSGGAVSLEEAVEMYDTARGTVAIDRERLKDGFGGDDLVMADLDDDARTQCALGTGEPSASNAQPKPVAIKRGAELARDISARAKAKPSSNKAKPGKPAKVEMTEAPEAPSAPSSDTTALDSFAAPYKAKFKKPEASILQRWKTRVLPAGLHRQGEAGAAAYLERYGKGIATPKVVALALCAEHEGAPDMAKGFWKKAYQLQTGVTLASNLPDELPSTKFTGPVAAPKISLPEFPDTLQPGYFHTMQAVNTHFKNGKLANTSIWAMPTPAEVEQARELLIADDDYWGQPKRDGERRAVWAGKTQNAYQARSANVRGAASTEIDAALQAAAKKFGPCTLDGEVYYPDVKGGEHRTASQAYNENVKLGRPEAPTPARYAIFTALYADGKDLRDGTQKARVEAGEKIGKWLEKKYPGVIELAPTARTKKEKAALCAKQKAEGREGEVWVKKDCAYRGGKQRGGDILRTKYRQELDVVVMGLTHTSADKRGFGALSVGVYGADGKLRSLGEIGTGYNEDEQMEILRRVKAGEKIVVTVSTQGRTESGQLWAAVFKDIRTDKAPEECVE
jgi:bifunctional non-homologous end joining protein LigD